ncbi:type VI secretion system baseplate subunit TssK, partial [Paraburkholderia ginsengiterrae]|uniref:type VI secretion system baseplate subunit TssK n=1 Tax=Paraburkholderia ginsengiterrae TaxID=1462993 RepID=UPI000A444BB0
LRLDDAQLELGKLAIRECAGVLPDRTPSAFSPDDAPPPGTHLPAHARHPLVVLASPVPPPGIPHAAPPPRAHTFPRHGPVHPRTSPPTTHLTPPPLPPSAPLSAPITSARPLRLSPRLSSPSFTAVTRPRAPLAPFTPSSSPPYAPTPALPFLTSSTHPASP